MSRCGGEQTDHLHGQPGRCWPLAGSFQGSRQLRRVLFFAVFFLPVTVASVESLANDSGEWRLLSRVQVNPPGVQAFVETFFSHNQLKAGPVGDLVLGFAAVPQNRTDTDVFLSRLVRSEDRWNPPVPFADSNDLERSAAIWIDRHSGAVHVAWVGNKRQKSRGTRSELRLGYRRSEDGGATWIPPRHFPVGTALARRPQLMGDGQGNLYLSISNGYAGKQERIHLFQSGDDGGTWRPVDVNFPEDQKRGNTAMPKLVVGPGGRACMVWLDATAGRRAVVFSMTTGDFDWSVPVRLNDDRTMSCTEPRLAVQEDSIYVAWNGVKGDRTTLYFDHSQDGGATWNSDQVVFDRKALLVQELLSNPSTAVLSPAGSNRQYRWPGPIGGSPIVSIRLRRAGRLLREGEIPCRGTTVPEGSITASTCCPGGEDAWWPIPRGKWGFRHRFIWPGAASSSPALQSC